MANGTKFPKQWYAPHAGKSFGKIVVRTVGCIEIVIKTMVVMSRIARCKKWATFDQIIYEVRGSKK